MKDKLIASDDAQPTPQDTNNPPPDRAAINRSNSQHSTGPRTDAGKKRSSLNALRHGLTSHTVVLQEEDPAEYQRRTQRFFDDLKPKDSVEEQLVQALADTAWRLNRVPGLETKLLTLGTNAHSESTDPDDPDAGMEPATVPSLQDKIRTLSSLSMHEYRLTRKFENTLKQLTERQAKRVAREETELENAGDLLEMHQEKDLTYDPAVDGFVFTNDEIAIYLQRKDRLKEANDAAVRRYCGAS